MRGKSIFLKISYFIYDNLFSDNKYLPSPTNMLSYLAILICVVTNYRVSFMDKVDFKELLWLCFWYQTFFPFIFMLETCVHFFISGMKIFFTFQSSSYDLAQFSNLTDNLKNEPNHRWTQPLKFLKTILFQISKCTHVSSIKMKEKNVATPNMKP